ncbi:MAG: efflux RND transporter periplasmic adaptor subunit [Rhodospirillaceae bacterium]|nr:efflux RND transporter periplasmic adaptor subunit [Rhodospirillaceae bacterium]
MNTVQDNAQAPQTTDRGVRHRKLALPLAAVLAAVLGGFWYFTGHGSQESAGRRAGAAAAPVHAAVATTRDMPVVDHALGKVLAPVMVQVTSRVQGVMESAHFKEGQFVKRGDLLFQIDPRPFQAVLDQAKAILARDQASLANATREHDRYAALKNSGNVSVQQFETVTTNAAMLAATVAADKAAIETAALNLDYTQIRSPIDGKTGPLLIQPGNMISANSTTPLVTIAQLQPIKVSFTLPQSELPRIQSRQKGKGLTALLDIKGAAGMRLEAPVDFTDNAVNAGSGTIELRATFDNADLSLVPGQLVNVRVEMDNIQGATVVPRDAVNDGPDGSFVYVVADRKALSRPVKVLFDDGDFAAISGDVKAGDQVVTEGQLRVVPGGLVNVLADRAAQAAGATAPE